MMQRYSPDGLLLYFPKKSFEKWFDLYGCINDSDKFTGSLESRDSLPYAEHIIQKRFRFIKRGVKERRQETVSRNPHTRIEGAEFVTVKK
ncbi:MAG: hypothetical protein LBB73_05215 [Dysgonamonadaceae bacterium]|jgi:hypothetical protein|nr:hypothetical protein [Dysgonamonadaceae bacterium]